MTKKWEKDDNYVNENEQTAQLSGLIPKTQVTGNIWKDIQPHLQCKNIKIK